MKTRRWFQIHLSTAFTMMLVISVLMYANLAPSYGELMPSGRSDVQLKWETWGWPSAAYGREMLVSAVGIHRPRAHWLGDPTFGAFCSGNNNYDAIVFDIFVAVSIVIATVWTSESLIRRRRTK